MKTLWRTLSLKALPVLVLALLAFTAAGASAQSDEMLVLDIKTQEVGLALVTLARSSRMQIMLKEETGARVQVEGLKGEYRFEDALSALLADTGLTFEYASRNVVLVQEAEQAVEQAVDEADEEDEEDDKLVLADQIVTGSRLEAGDPTARIYSFTAEDIARRGTANLEEFFRTLPWFYSSITSQTTSQPYNSVPNDSDEAGINFGLGVSTVNMRALGSANTLVLIDGRRVVGTAGKEGGFVNLATIPVGSIKRIDIQLDGSSSVYGADAIGGVINIITKKSYEGLSATYRREFSATDADSRKMNMQAGYAWESGKVIAHLSRNSSQAINQRKIFTSNDFRDLFGPEYDLRDPSIGQPGVVCAWNGSYRYHGCLIRPVYPRVLRQRLPPGHSGVGATPDDFVNVRPWNDAALGDLVEPQNGELSTHDSISLKVEQRIGDKFRAYARTMVSNRDSYREYRAELNSFLIPASNAYNPFGEHVVVNYDPSREFEDGQFRPGYTETWSKLRRYSAGFDWNLGGHQLAFNVSRSDSERQGLRTDFFYDRSELDPNAAKFYEALASSDPAVAVNLFGDGTVQGSGFQYIASPRFNPQHSNSKLTSVEPTLRGSLFHVWGGPIGYAVGAEWRRSAIWFAYLVRGEDGSFYDYNAKVDATGVERPTVETSSYFAELSFPIVGRENARPGLLSLVLSAKARLDVYESSGALGGQVGRRQTGIPVRSFVPGEGWQDVGTTSLAERVGEIEFGEVSRRQMSPRVGLSYRPVEDIRVRAAWSESFRPPQFSQTFNTADIVRFQSRVSDPLHPVRPYDIIQVEYAYIPYRPGLEPESSNNYSLGFEWSPKAIPGFTWTVDWSLIDYTNRIINSQSLLRSHPEIAYNLPEIVDRDENGYLLRVRIQTVNLAQRVSKLLNNNFKYAFDTRFGHFTPTLTYTRFLEDYSRVSLGSERLETKGTTAGMNEYEVVASLGWAAGRISANLFIRYIPEWKSVSNRGCLWVVGDCFTPYQQMPHLEADSLVRVDLTMTYQFDSGLRLRAGGQNVFGAESPVLWNQRPYDPTRWNARGRVLFLEMNWEM